MEIFHYWIVIKIFESFLNELLTCVSFYTRLLPYVFLKCIPMGSHSEIFSRKSVLYDIFKVPVMLFKLCFNKGSLSVRCWKIQIVQVFIAIFSTILALMMPQNLKRLSS